MKAKAANVDWGKILNEFTPRADIPSFSKRGDEAWLQELEKLICREGSSSEGEADRYASIAPTVMTQKPTPQAPQERIGNPEAVAAPSTHFASSETEQSSATDLIDAATEAIRLAEMRALEAERTTQELKQYYAGQLKILKFEVVALKLHATAAKRREQVAISRAIEAEQYLLQFHDAVVNGLKGVLPRKEQDSRQRNSPSDSAWTQRQSCLS